MKRIGFIVVLIAILLSACNPAAEATKLYDEGQALYVNASKGYSDFVLCQTLENQQIEQTFKLAYQAQWADIEQKKEYRAAMNAPVQSAASAPKATAVDGSKVVDFNNLPATASPDSIYKSGLSFSFYAVQEAQIIPVAPEIFAKAQDSIQVANNHKFQCGQSWNNTVAAYNTWRRQVKGRVVGDLANYFHIEDMPKELPMFSVENFQPGAAPDTSNPYGPTQTQ